MKLKNKTKSILSAFLAVCMLLSISPVTTFAAQSNEYVDPADNWLSSNNRTNELDVNATTTYETQFCCVCNMQTTVLTYRVPEYTRSGETALNRDVRYSDGTCLDEERKGNLDSGTPGIDAYYTGYHWTKAVCQNCGTINSGDGMATYSFNNNVYSLNPCDNNFFLQFDNTTHEKYDDEYHLTTLKRGEYCKFCKGTYARATRGLADHNFTEQVDGQVANNRFYIAETCDDCGYETSEYVTAKAVVSSYYGVEDGEAHTLTVSDLSDSGVKTSIRYGTDADNCNKTSAPNYTQAGYYTVYYKINYTYSGETMTENGVSYVHILADESDEGGSNTIIVVPPAHEHDFRYLETIPASCENLGYERWQCDSCGELQKMNYSPAKGHNYEDITIREATCKQGGLKLTLCKDCGDFHQETTPTGNHNYHTTTHNATCRSVGYTDHICEVCGDNFVTDIKPLISHAYEHITKEPTCEDKGYTTYYDGNTAQIPDFCRITPIENDDSFIDDKIKRSMELANSLDRFFVAHDMDYAAKYSDGAMAMKLSESLYNGRTDYIKDMLADLGQTDDDVLPLELKEYEEKYIPVKYFIYQLKSGDDTRDFRFESLERLHSKGEFADKNNYDLIYSAAYMPSDTLEKLFQKFNIDIPQDFKGHSLSVSDIVVISGKGEEKAYYCDSVGFKEVPEFLDYIRIRSAVISNYEGYTALVGTDDKVYLGANENYHYMFDAPSYYDNSDKSVIHISDNHKMYSFLYGDGWVVSQQQMLENGAFTTENYAEFAELKTGVLSRLKCKKEITFAGEPFNYLANAEKHTEQNFNQIDGLINNEPPKPSIREQIKNSAKEHGEKKEPSKAPHKSEPEL